MKTELLLASYKSLALKDKLILAACILYDLDVGDYSASEREADWTPAFEKMITHLENEIGRRAADDILTQIERDANRIMEGAEA